MTMLAGFFLVLGPVLYLWGWRALRRRWMITGMPTSKARSVAMGLAEIKGKARPLGPESRLSPVMNIPCVWSRVVVSEHKNEGGKNARTRILINREIREPFIVEDDTGRVAVLPAGAEIRGVTLTDMRIYRWENLPPEVLKFFDMNVIPLRMASVWARAHYYLKEEAIITGSDMYVLGEAVPGRDSVADGRRRDIAGRLKAWLKDPAKKAEVDANKDGIIQQEEWDAAQHRAQDEVLREDMGKTAEAQSPMPPVAIRRPVMGFFLVSSGTEKEALQAEGNPVALISLGLVSVGAGVCLAPPGSWAVSMFWGSMVIMVFGSFLGGIRRVLGR